MNKTKEQLEKSVKLSGWVLSEEVGDFITTQNTSLIKAIIEDLEGMKVEPEIYNTNEGNGYNNAIQTIQSKLKELTQPTPSQKSS